MDLTYNTRTMNQVRPAHKPPFGVFLATSVVIFFLSLSAADSVGFVPYYIDGTDPSPSRSTTPTTAATPTDVALTALPLLGNPVAQATTATSVQVHTALPVRIRIDAIDLDLVVQNPQTTDIQALDDDLQKGPARYVKSAQLGEAGNMIIFAHSSHLPIVHNKMFQAFNRVPELAAGDSITITGDDGVQYLYSVVSVTKADATDAQIDLVPNDGTHLTLVTCDTLTGKSARFVLDATLVGTEGKATK